MRASVGGVGGVLAWVTWWCACVGGVLAWVACEGGGRGGRARVGGVGGVGSVLSWVAC